MKVRGRLQVRDTHTHTVSSVAVRFVHYLSYHESYRSFDAKIVEGAKLTDANRTEDTNPLTDSVHLKEG